MRIDGAFPETVSKVGESLNEADLCTNQPIHCLNCTKQAHCISSTDLRQPADSRSSMEKDCAVIERTFFANGLPDLSFCQFRLAMGDIFPLVAPTTDD